MKLIRPTKEMMLAINAQLSGNAKEAEGLVREHGLSRREMELRIQKRGGEKYDLAGKKRGRGRGRGKVIASASAPARDIINMIDGRTKTSTLVKLEGRISEILTGRDAREVSKVRDAMKTINDLRRKLQAAESLIGQ